MIYYDVNKGFNIFRSVAMGWHGEANATPGQQNATFLPPLGIFLHFFNCCFIFVDNERSEIVVQLNLGLCKILESSIFSCTHIVHVIVIT